MPTSRHGRLFRNRQIKADGSDADGNGILLRADLHKLFDADLLAIDPADGAVWLHSSCREEYEELRGCPLRCGERGGTRGLRGAMVNALPRLNSRPTNLASLNEWWSRE
ncbi:HNH endonuclease [Sphingomonas gei]|uniref:HNH endonuclease n=1 Tax=Sphingomonas gei TaxID=1395960 RepID=A0A4V3QY26_9SPHN|nr:HNH endonuclease [Sphingomonas gei]